ncbi:MAG: PAS domain S-box protein [Thermomicrobiales bacterium]
MSTGSSDSAAACIDAEILRTSEARQRAMLDSLAEGIVFQDADGRIVRANPSAERILGLTADQLENRDSRDPRWGCVREDGSPFPDDEHPALQSLRTGADCDGVIMGVQRPDGSLVWISVSTRPLCRNGEQRPYAVVSTFADVTAERAAAKELRAVERRYQTVFAAAPIGMGLAGRDGRWLEVNRSLCDLLGYSEPELLALTFEQVTHPDDVAADLLQARRLWAGLISGFRMEKRYLRKDGATVWIELTVSVVDDEGGDPLYTIAHVQDIRERKANEAEMRHRALHDALTGLANRGHFLDRLREAAAVARGGDLAALYLDLDGFQAVNDEHGHDEGDRLLAEVGRRLRGLAADDVLPGRLGGDEFAVLVRGDRRRASEVRRAVKELIDAPFMPRRGPMLRMTPSVGLAIAGPGATAESLIREADEAMYDEKRSGTGSLPVRAERPERDGDQGMTSRSRSAVAASVSALPVPERSIVALARSAAIAGALSGP